MCQKFVLLTSTICAFQWKCYLIIYLFFFFDFCFECIKWKIHIGNSFSSLYIDLLCFERAYWFNGSAFLSTSSSGNEQQYSLEISNWINLMIIIINLEFSHQKAALTVSNESISFCSTALPTLHYHFGRVCLCCILYSESKTKNQFKILMDGIESLLIPLSDSA